MKPLRIALIGGVIVVGILLFLQGRHPPKAEPFRANNASATTTRENAGIPQILTRLPASNAAPTLRRNLGAETASVNPELVIQELRHFDDPSAEQLVDLLAQAGWSKEEQVARFKESYDQLMRIYQFSDLAIDHRVDMRRMFESVATNRIDSLEARRESQKQYMAIQNAFEEEMRTRQASTLSNLLVFLGPPPQMGADELQRRLLEIHPLVTIHGPITNSLPQPAPAP